MEVDIAAESGPARCCSAHYLMALCCRAFQPGSGSALYTCCNVFVASGAWLVFLFEWSRGTRVAAFSLTAAFSFIYTFALPTPLVAF